jgi:hypothetical protein
VIVSVKTKQKSNKNSWKLEDKKYAFKTEENADDEKKEKKKRNQRREAADYVMKNGE